MRIWKLALMIGGLSAVAVFAAAAIASGAGGDRHGLPFGGGMMAAAGGPDGRDDAWRGCGGAGQLEDPQAREDVQLLRTEHREDVRAWWEKYGENRSSDAAREALDELRADHAADMGALFERYDVEPPARLGEGGSAGNGLGHPCGDPGGQGCGGQGWNGGQGMMGGSGGWNGTGL